MKTMKKYLAVMIAIFMIAGVMPAAVYASPEEGDVAEEILATEESAPVPELDEAVGPESIETVDEASEVEAEAIIPEEPSALDASRSSEEMPILDVNVPSEAAADEIKDEVPEEIVGAGVEVGDGVTVSFNAATGTVMFDAAGGFLWNSWLGKSGIQRDKIKEIDKTYYLDMPADSSFIFYDLVNLKKLNLWGFYTHNVTNMQYMFCNCRSLKDLNFRDFHTPKVTNMEGMFFGCSSLSNLILLSELDTSKVTDMTSMFSGCSSLTNLNLDNFKTSNVKSLAGMFQNCKRLSNLDLSSFDTSKVTEMGYLFDGCSSLTNLDLSSFDTSKVTYGKHMLDGCTSLEIIRTPKKNSIGTIKLPYTMYDSKGKKYTTMPVLSKSIVLGKTQKAAKDFEAILKGFSDVKDPTHPYYKAIYWAAKAGITKGYPDGTFGINKSCTRGEMIMFLWRFAGRPAPASASKSPFKDVPTTHTFYKAVLWAYQTGITKGYGDGTFGINRNVSRGECMMFLWRIKGKPAPLLLYEVSPIKDVPATHVFYKAILWGLENGITKGYTSGPKKGNFGLNDNCTRGQIVTFLYRAR